MIAAGRPAASHSGPRPAAEIAHLAGLHLDNAAEIARRAGLLLDLAYEIVRRAGLILDIFAETEIYRAEIP